jgi:hypothetical protein
MTKKRRGGRRRSGTPHRLQPLPRLETPEGDPMVFAIATYRNSAPDEVRRLLTQAADFDLNDELVPEADGSLEFPWLETRSGAPRFPEPMGQRVLALLTLTPATLRVGTFSMERLAGCQRRLEELLGDRIELEDVDFQPVESVLRRPVAGPEPELAVPPPEVVAEIEEKMILQWLDESIPALDGLTPREAARTPEGRQKLLALFDYIDRQQARLERPPGMFSPDYNKAKKMLGLE